jgi:hypothetical protein
MNAGKTMLLQASYKYRERGMTTMLFVAGQGSPICRSAGGGDGAGAAGGPRGICLTGLIDTGEKGAARDGPVLLSRIADRRHAERM